MSKLPDCCRLLPFARISTISATFAELAYLTGAAVSHLSLGILIHAYSDHAISSLP
jgi:hypothetical protein